MTVRIDHEGAKSVLTMSDASGKLARMCLRLVEFKFDIVNRAGINHQAADALPILVTTGTDNMKMGDEAPVLNIKPEKIQSVHSV